MTGIKNTVILGNIVIWAGLYIGCIVEDLPVDFTFKDVCDWVEKMSVDDVKKITECYKVSINFPVPDKKKAAPKKNLKSRNTKRGASK